MEVKKLCDEDFQVTGIATLPLILLIDGGTIWEADSIRGLMQGLIDEYADAEDEIDDWLLRVKFARKIAMANVEIGEKVIVYDNVKGIIKNNYASIEDDDDYKEEFNINDAIKIDVSSDKEFLKSLVRLRAISILEREDSKYFSSDIVECNKCSHKVGDKCPIYKCSINSLVVCENGTDGKIKRYKGGRYSLINV